MGAGNIEKNEGIRAPYTIEFKTLSSISSRTSFADEMRLNIYDQTDVHNGYIAEGIDDGPSPEMIERSLHRMASRCTVPSIGRNGAVFERKVYVAAVDGSMLEELGLEPGTTMYLNDDILYVYLDDGLDMIPGSHDVFELISDLEDLFIMIAVRSLLDIGFADTADRHIVFFLRRFSDDYCPETLSIDLRRMVDTTYDATEENPNQRRDDDDDCSASG